MDYMVVNPPKNLFTIIFKHQNAGEVLAVCNWYIGMHCISLQRDTKLQTSNIV